MLCLSIEYEEERLGAHGLQAAQRTSMKGRYLQEATASVAYVTLAWTVGRCQLQPT